MSRQESPLKPWILLENVLYEFFELCPSARWTRQGRNVKVFHDVPDIPNCATSGTDDTLAIFPRACGERAGHVLPDISVAIGEIASFGNWIINFIRRYCASIRVPTELWTTQDRR